MSLKEEKIKAIKQRILDEQRKHSTLDWAEIAARKIYSEMTENTPVTTSHGTAFEQKENKSFSELVSHLEIGKEAKSYNEMMNEDAEHKSNFHEIDFYNGAIYLLEKLSPYIVKFNNQKRIATEIIKFIREKNYTFHHNGWYVGGQSVSSIRSDVQLYDKFQKVMGVELYGDDSLQTKIVQFVDWAFKNDWSYYCDLGTWGNQNGIVIIEFPTSPLYVSTQRLYTEFLEKNNTTGSKQDPTVEYLRKVTENLFDTESNKKAFDFVFKDRAKDNEKPIESNSVQEWICNECNAPNYTKSVSKEDVEAEKLSCIDCGGVEFHLNNKKQ